MAQGLREEMAAGGRVKEKDAEDAMNPIITAAAIRKGILMLMLGLAMFSTMDAVAKGLLQSYPTAQVVWARFIRQVLLVLVILGPKRVGPSLPTSYLWLHLARSSFQLATTGLFFFRLGYIGLAEATALAI